MAERDDSGNSESQQPGRKLPPPAAGGADRNLLFGILALQMDFISRDALIAGMNAWVLDKSRPLSAILVEQKQLTAEHRDLLVPLVAAHLKRHANDAERSLASLSSVASVQQELQHIADADVAASLMHLSAGGGDTDPYATIAMRSSASGPTGTRFRILRPFASGGLGMVSVALDEELHREVAFKEIQPRHANDAASRERFVAEAEITGGLEHPGIVPVYGLGQYSDGRPFYAMRFIRGDSLKTAIESYHRADNPNRHDAGARQLALRQLLGRFIDICNALEYAHSRGVLHRDLKPGNVMLGKYGETLVVDWGLAKAVGRNEITADEVTFRLSSALSSSGQTQPGSAIGTPAYMSPEQAAGQLEQLGPATDIYGLGATLYHILAGQPPFKGLPADVLQQVARSDFPPPRSINPEVPRALEAICLKAMALKPADRYAGARHLADDLEHWLADEPVVAAPDALGERLSRLGRKHKSYIRAAVGALVLIAVVSLVAVFLVNQLRKDALDAAERERDATSEALALAARNKILADEKGALAERNAQLAKEELQERLATERQLRLATAERLATLSYTKRSQSPQLSLLLAVESGLATREDEGGVLPTTHQLLLDALSLIGGRPLFGHHDAVTSVLISLDSRRIVTTSRDHTARVWDLTAEDPGANPRVLAGHEDAISRAAISADSRWVVTGSADRTARIWDLADAGPGARVLKGHQTAIASVDISPDGRRVATGGLDDTARLWDLTGRDPSAGPQVLSTTGRSPISGLAFSPDNRWLITGSGNGSATIWDLMAEPPGAGPHLVGEDQGGGGIVAISPDGHWLVTAGWGDTAQVWDLTVENPGASPHVLRGHRNLIQAAAISLDSRWVITGAADHTARIWDLATENPGANPRVLTGHQGGITSVAISLDSRWVVTGSMDHTARLWDLTAENPNANPRVLAGHDNSIVSVAMSSSNRWIVTGSLDNTARHWDLTDEYQAANPMVLPEHRSGINSVAISADNRWVATASSDRFRNHPARSNADSTAQNASEHPARIWDLKARHAIDRPHVLKAHPGKRVTVAISPDNRWVVTGSDDRTARVWDLSAEDPGAGSRLLSGHQDAVESVTISPDSHWVITGSDDNTARVWDLTAENPGAVPRVLSARRWGTLGGVVISPDSRRVVTAGHDDTVRIWDLTAGDPGDSPRVMKAHRGPVHSVAISADSRRVVTVSADKTVLTWELTAADPGATARVLIENLGAFTSITVSPDCRWVVTANGVLEGTDHTARIWDLTSASAGSSPRVLTGHQSSITCLAISPDSRWVVTGSGDLFGNNIDNTARLWDLTAENPSDSPLVLRGHQKMITAVNFSGDGRWIVTASADNTVRVWRWRWDDLLTLAGEVAGRNFSRSEWEQYFPREPYRRTFADAPD